MSDSLAHFFDPVLPFMHQFESGSGETASKVTGVVTVGRDTEASALSQVRDGHGSLPGLPDSFTPRISADAWAAAGHLCAHAAIAATERDEPEVAAALRCAAVTLFVMQDETEAANAIQ